MDTDQTDQAEVKNLHGIADFYLRDAVAHKKSGLIGTVTSGCDGEIDEDDYYYDDDEDDYYYDDDKDEEEEDGGWEEDGGCNEGIKTENLTTDQKQVRILSSDGKRKFWNVSDITLADRMLFHGEYVAYVTDPNGQLGVVQDVNVSVDLLAPDGSILKDISTRDLGRAFEFYIGDCVVLGPWIGTIDDVLLDIMVLTDDGSTCKVIKADPLHLVPTDGIFGYYPGQRVRASSSSVFRKSWWLSSFWKTNPLEGVVTQVTVRSVFVEWITSSGYGPNCSTAPSKEQSPKNLKRVSSCLYHAEWQVGDWCFFHPSILRSSSISGDLARNGCKSRPMNLVATNANPRGKEYNFEPVYQITKANRKVSVLWQDGTMGHCIDSKLLFLRGINDFDLVPQQYVWEKSHDDSSETRHRRCGIIQSVNSKERTACVRWLEDPVEFDTEEIVSVYELEGHPDYDYCNGNIVFRSVSVATDVSCVGHITGLKNGDIEVTWADGMVSTVGPQEIYAVNLDADNLDNVDDNESIAIVFAQILTESLVLAPIDFAKRLATKFFWWRKNVYYFSRGEDELQGQGTTNICEENDSNCHRAPITSNASEEGSCNLETERLEADALDSDHQTPNFKRFDGAKDPSDHHFLVRSGQVNNGRKWLKKVQQDWSILENNLPDGVYVRVYEDRMDLIRAVIVGPSGTPYQDGLFFFDFYLPPDYPDNPPSAHYHSGGWRINPNLYEGGQVCLSLLNTWSGNTNEVWDPTSSSILQVLISLQGLVLTSRPYFNEPGYDKQVGKAEGEKNSLSYNENTLLLSCKTMMYLMRRPPKDFEKLVKDHFKRRGRYILKACDAYMGGSLTGLLSRDDALTATEETPSVGFKLMLAKIMPKLYSALTEVGADCADFEHLVPGKK